MRGFCPCGRRRSAAMARPRKYPPELLDRGARVVIDSGRPIAHVARDLGVPAETLRRHLRRVEADEGLRPDLPTSAEREEIKALRKEIYELRGANEILKAASVFSRPSCIGTHHPNRRAAVAPRGTAPTSRWAYYRYGRRQGTA